MPSHPAVMEEAGGDPQGDEIVAIVGHEWDDSCDWWVYKVEWKQGGQGWMPVSVLSRLTCEGLAKVYHTSQGFLPAVLPEDWFNQSLETQTSDDEDSSPRHP